MHGLTTKSAAANWASHLTTSLRRRAWLLQVSDFARCHPPRGESQSRQGNPSLLHMVPALECSFDRLQGKYFVAELAFGRCILIEHAGGLRAVHNAIFNLEVPQAHAQIQQCVESSLSQCLSGQIILAPARMIGSLPLGHLHLTANLFSRCMFFAERQDDIESI